MILSLLLQVLGKTHHHGDGFGLFYLCVSVFGGRLHMEIRGQFTGVGAHYHVSSGIKFRSSGLVTGAFNHLAILLALDYLINVIFKDFTFL